MKKEEWEKAPKSSAEVCHQWASQRKQSAKYGNIHFEGDTIYSYGWYPMAKWCTDLEGKPYVIISSFTYSRSTSRHFRYVYNAIPKNVNTYISSITEGSYFSRRNYPLLTNEAVLKHFLKKIKECYEDGFKKSSYRAMYLDPSPEGFQNKSKHIYKAAKEFCKKTGTKWEEEFDVWLISDLEVKNMHFIADPVIAEQKEKKRIAEERQRAIDKAHDEAVKKYGKSSFEMAKEWIREGGNLYRFMYIDIPEDDEYVKLTKGGTKLYVPMATAMRIVGDEVVTNMSARVPVRHAKLLWEAIKAGKEVKGMRVGLYTVSSMNGELIIGCHHISREIIDYFVEYYKW